MSGSIGFLWGWREQRVSHLGGLGAQMEHNPPWGMCRTLAQKEGLGDLPSSKGDSRGLLGKI